MKLNSPPELVILGIDGGTWDLIVPWVKEGLLPNFAGLLSEGAWGNLESTVPPVTAPAWTSFMTGKNPGKHGIYDFLEPQHLPEGGSDTYRMQYVSASSRKAKTIWKILSDQGKRVGVVNVPMTYPPEEINGYMISGMDAPDEDSPFIYPPSLREELWKELGGVSLDIRHLGYMKNDRKRRKVLRELIELEKKRLRLILYLFEKHPADVFMMVFNATDQVQHHFWHYMDPRHHQYDEKGHKKYGRAILEVYQCIDEIMGKLMDVLPEETKLVLMSDHGFGPISPRCLYINRYLEEKGLLTVKEKEDTGSKFLLPLASKADSILRSILPPGMKNKIAKLFPKARAAFESYLAFSSFDWAKTTAYASEISITSLNIWLNMEGRYPQGTVPLEDYDRTLERVRNVLYELIDPKTGKQVIARVYRKEEVYHGREAAHAPDLIVSWWDGGGFTVKPSYPKDSRHSGVIEYAPRRLKAGTDWSGTHKPNGIVLFRGKGIKNIKFEDAKITDVAPTVLYLLGQPVPDDMDGQVLLEMLKEPGPAGVSYQKVSGAHPLNDGPEESSSPYSERDEEQIRKRLEELGYLL
jgi:predicted AlkP superfamily phosphohydrolase/phosphomutase